MLKADLLVKGNESPYLSRYSSSRIFLPLFGKRNKIKQSVTLTSQEVTFHHAKVWVEI